MMDGTTNPTSAPGLCLPLAGLLIAVLGASGKLGRQIVPLLRNAGADVVLFGRQTARLHSRFPDLDCQESTDFARIASGRKFAAVLDLATLNNTASADLAEFRAVNVARPLALIGQADEIRVPLYVVFSSTHALDVQDKHPYAVSKRELREKLLSSNNPAARIVVLPKIVVAARGSIRARVWALLGTLKPVALFADLAETLVTVIVAGRAAPRETYVEPLAQHTYAAISRVLDFFVALLLLIGASWLMLLIGLAVKLDSQGPAIFAQRRLGRNEVQFTLYKFRTMTVGTREAGTHEVSAASVTGVGAVLRRLKLDELPQLINILRGELALIGPRPCLPIQHELVERRRAAGVFALRPGLTGLAQVNGVDMSDPAKLVEWEVRYVRLRRLLLDLSILIKTFRGHGSGDRTSPDSAACLMS